MKRKDTKFGFVILFMRSRKFLTDPVRERTTLPSRPTITSDHLPRYSQPIPDTIYIPTHPNPNLSLAGHPPIFLSLPLQPYPPIQRRHNMVRCSFLFSDSLWSRFCLIFFGRVWRVFGTFGLYAVDLGGSYGFRLDLVGVCAFFANEDWVFVDKRSGFRCSFDVWLGLFYWICCDLALCLGWLCELVWFFYWRKKKFCIILN